MSIFLGIFFIIVLAGFCGTFQFLIDKEVEKVVLADFDNIRRCRISQVICVVVTIVTVIVLCKEYI